MNFKSRVSNNFPARVLQVQINIIFSDLAYLLAPVEGSHGRTSPHRRSPKRTSAGRPGAAGGPDQLRDILGENPQT